MSSETLKLSRRNSGETQHRAAARLGVTQAYYSMLESRRRRLARKLMRAYAAPPTLLPVSEPAARAGRSSNPEYFARELASLGYPGFAHLPRVRQTKNPAEFLLAALGRNDLEARVTEGLPWLVARYPEMDFDWLVPRARARNLQNRLGFTVTLARQASRNGALQPLETDLRESKLAKEDSYCQELNEPERRWLREFRSEEAREWNLLSDFRAEDLRYIV